MTNRHLVSLALMTAVLAASVSLAPTAHALGAKKDKPAPQQQTAKKEATPSKKLQAKPVLTPEAKQSIQDAATKLDPDTRTQLNKLSEAIHLEDRAVYNDLRDDEELAVTDIGMLWEAAVERSGTIRYAIEKLSHKDATGKPVEGDSFSKRMLQNLVHLGGVAGSMWAQNPAGLIGSNMVQDLMSGNPAQDPALSRVTDADMVILAKEVEALQSQLIERYYDYRHARERLSLAQEASSTIAKYYDHATGDNNSTGEALQPLLQSIYDSAKQDEQNAQQAVISARTGLALVVGPDAVVALEQAGTKKKQAASKPAS